MTGRRGSGISGGERVAPCLAARRGPDGRKPPRSATISSPDAVGLVDQPASQDRERGHDVRMANLGSARSTQPSFAKHATNATKWKSAEEELLQTVEEYANDLRETLEKLRRMLH